MSGFSLSDSDNLERIADALERMAAADERRNEPLELDAARRSAAWEQSRQDTQEALDRLVQ